MASKATHNGECQLCGRVQALPYGTLAKHGYNVRWNFFMGVCPGSGYLPFELSTDRIHAAIETARTHASALRVQAVHIVCDVTPDITVAWAFVYNRDRGTREWKEVEIESAILPILDRNHREFTYRNPFGGRKEPVEGYPKTTIEAVLIMNRRRANWLNSQAVEQDRYADWQVERIKGWVERPLKPRQ